MPIEVPEVVRAKARAAGAEAWLAGLPALVRELAADWQLEIGAVFDGGTEAYVAAVTRADRTPAVLKLLIPRDREAAAREATVLRLAAGAGCAALYEEDAERGALLLERLGPSLYDLRLPVAERHEILCAVAQPLWRPAPGAGLPSGAWKGRWLAGFIPPLWEELGRPCAERSVEHALACAERRVAAHDDARAVLVHGDVHQWNTLRTSGGDGWKLVDPDGLLAEPEYELGVLMREDPHELLHGGSRLRARKFAARTGLDADAIWEWGVVERVSTGLIATQIGLDEEARAMLAVADRLSG